MRFPIYRPRRLRQNPKLRALVRETELSVSHLVLPLFVREGSRLTVYIGAASGGVWKSVNGGTTYKPVFDKQPVQSIGAIAIDPKNPKTVWVGTGEANRSTFEPAPVLPAGN